MKDQRMKRWMEQIQFKDQDQLEGIKYLRMKGIIPQGLETLPMCWQVDPIWMRVSRDQGANRNPN